MSITVTFDTSDDLAKFAAIVALNPTLAAKIDTVVSMITTIKQEEDVLAADLSQLQADVAQDTSVDMSAENLLTQLSGMLGAAIAALPDPTQLMDLHTQLQQNISGLAAAVAANTPVGMTGATGGTGGTGATGP